MTRFQWYRKLTGTKSKSFPDWISKTDETRLQNIPWVLLDEKDRPFYVTEKMDGQSATYWVKSKLFGWEFGICSRTVRKHALDGSNWSRAAKDLKIKEKLLKVGKNIAIQGELCGPGIQKNKYSFDGYRLFIFNVFDIDAKRWYNVDELEWFCNLYGFNCVPVLTKSFQLLNTVNKMGNYSDGKSVYGDTLREGLVFRSNDSGKPLSFKMVSPKFLLKYGE